MLPLSNFFSISDANPDPSTQWLPSGNDQTADNNPSYFPHMYVPSPVETSSATTTRTTRKQNHSPPGLLPQRQRNVIASRKSRKKKMDRIQDLETALEKAINERDELKMRLARQEAETETLKSIMRLGESGGR